MSRTRSLTARAGVLGAALVLAGCSFEASTGGDSVDADTLADEVSSQLAESVGQEPDDVTCSDDLEAEVDAETRCELTAGDQTYGVTVTVTEVQDGNASFDIQVDDEPQG